MRKIFVGLALWVAFVAGCSNSPKPVLIPTADLEPKDPVFQGEYLDVKDASRPPVLVRPMNPHYPSSLRNAGIQGIVHLAYIVGTDGRPQQVQVLAANHPDFGPPAKEAVEQWRFRPGTKDGVPVAVAVKQIVTFNLD